jgi:hypothetical protein
VPTSDATSDRQYLHWSGHLSGTEPEQILPLSGRGDRIGFGSASLILDGSMPLDRYTLSLKKLYSHRPVGRTELKALVKLAHVEEKAFFTRNPRLIRPYRSRLLAVALCQGAALQRIGCDKGVKDFDVHFFYEQNSRKPLLSRTVKRIFATVGAFHDVPVDFIRTIVPLSPTRPKPSAAERIKTFLQERPTSNARFLSQKAVVGLSPDRLFDKVLWRREQLLEKA